MQMLITLSVGEVKTVYVRCDKQRRGATPKAAQTCIETWEHWHHVTQQPLDGSKLATRTFSGVIGEHCVMPWNRT